MKMNYIGIWLNNWFLVSNYFLLGLLLDIDVLHLVLDLIGLLVLTSVVNEDVQCVPVEL